MVSTPTVVVLLAALMHGYLAAEPTGTRCYDCSEVTTLADCTHITICDPNEQCFINKYKETSGAVKFQLGCAPKERCLILEARRSLNDLDPGQPAKRAEPYSLCQDCCNEDYCNVHGCSSAQDKQHLRCMRCDEGSDPSSCFEVTICGEYQSCFVHEDFRRLGYVYTTKCETKEFCSKLNNGAPPIGKRERDLCITCCDVSHCNAKVCSPLYNSTHQPEPMKVVMPPADVTVDGTGKTAKFVCQVTGQAEYRWYFAGLDGTNRTLTGHTNTHGQSEVTVANVTSVDAGRYVCSAVHDNQSMQLTAVLNVTQQPTKPVITFLPKDTAVAAGKSVTFTCTATGYPEPKIEWGHFDIFNFPEAAETISGVTVLGNTMTISSVSASHEGVYVCRAGNSAGFTSGQFSLSVH